MSDTPRNLVEFIERYSSDSECADYLMRKRWPAGFICSKCKTRSYWRLRSRPHVVECACCRTQVSIIVGTFLSVPLLPLSVWFAATFLVTSSNGCSPRDLAAFFGLNEATAWTLAMGVRKAMRAQAHPDLGPKIEIGVFKAQSWKKKMTVLCATPRRAGAITSCRLHPTSIVDANALARFIRTITYNVKDGHEVTDARGNTLAFPGREELAFKSKSAGTIGMLFRRWQELQSSQGLQDLQGCLDEFAFRYNSKRQPRHPFDTLMDHAYTSFALKPHG